MTQPNWEDVDVPRGAFISWGNTPGQHVTGKVLSYDPTIGTDFKGHPCPQIAIELIEPAASISKEGQRTDFDAGELVVLNCGQVSLKRAVVYSAPVAGDLVKIILSKLVPSQNGTVKEYEIKIARGAGASVPQPSRQPQPQQAQTFATQPQASPPF